MQFTMVAKNRWEAKDDLDLYEIVRYQGQYCCIKNDVVWFDTTSDLENAVIACDTEQREQEWDSQNPDNFEKNVAARKQRLKDRTLPKLWRGR